LGVGLYALIVGAYFAVRPFFDFSGIAQSLSSGAGVTKENFLFVSLYISFVNSLLEEFFFRGFCFFSLRPLGLPTAYIVSALLFSAYHVAFMDGWLSPVIFALALFGMALGGGIFAFLNHKTESLLPSYLVHMASNLATNLIGIMMFYS
jgi:membrane protease YdiL (CAAX protease family)